MSHAALGPVTVGIIGGLGRMGRWLQGRLQQAGCRVLVTDAKLGPLTPAFVQACQVLVLAVPVTAVEQVMRTVGPHTRPDGLVMDLCSLKREPLRAMLEQARGEVVGCHPLFGPATESLAGQVVFLCPGRGGIWPAWARGFWEQAGARVVEIDPDRHDWLMARVQTLRHLVLFGLGRALMQAGFQPAQDLELAGPWFAQLMGLLERQAQQPAELYADLALNNPHGLEAAQALAQGVGELASLLEGGDRQGLLELLGEIELYARAFRGREEEGGQAFSCLTKPRA